MQPGESRPNSSRRAFSCKMLQAFQLVVFKRISVCVCVCADYVELRMDGAWRWDSLYCQADSAYSLR